MPFGLIISFPNLANENWNIASEATSEYNCIAWAAHDNERWWWPDPSEQYYWPPSLLREETRDCFMRAYGTLGYEVCYDSSVEAGFEKIAIYVGDDGKPTHAARQLSNGKWTSKLGNCHDIEHETANGVSGTAYGQVAVYMRRTARRS